MYVSVIDLGSNTFHLLIVEVSPDNTFKEVYRHRVFTGLCEGGIDHLKENSIDYGLDTCKVFKSKMNEFNVTHSLITGTAALRSAKNKSSFIIPAEKIFNQNIDIIDGQEEAELIFKGIRQLHPMNEPTLIMDIGGGSTEFIIVKDGNILWKNSYKLGVGVMYALFHHTEPINKEDEINLRNHIGDVLSELKIELKNIIIESLIGASGSFEVLESMTGLVTHYNTPNEIGISKTEEIIEKIIKANYSERLVMDGLPEERVKYIVVAMILIDEVLKMSNPKEIIVSPFALKEGLIIKLIEKFNSL